MSTTTKQSSDARKRDANKFLEDILGESLDSDDDSPDDNNDSDSDSGNDDIAELYQKSYQKQSNSKLISQNSALSSKPKPKDPSLSNTKTQSEEQKSVPLKSATESLMQIQSQNQKKNLQSQFAQPSSLAGSVLLKDDSIKLSHIGNLNENLSRLDRFNSIQEGSSSSDDEEDNKFLQSLLQNQRNKHHQRNNVKSYNKQDSSNFSTRVDTPNKNLEKQSSTGDSSPSKLSRFGSSAKSGQKENYRQTDIIQIIENNEKMNESGPDKLIDKPSQLLSFDNKFYNVKKNLFVYMDFPQITKKLYQQKDHQYSGIVSSISIFSNYIFVGNSQGIIRVFDFKTQKEMKPLMENNLIGQNKVSCIEVSQCGGFLLSGYKKGQIALWSLEKYKLLRYASDFHQSEVINAKIFNILNNDEQISVLSCEENGPVAITEFKKSSFIGMGSYNHTSQFLFKTRLKGPASLSLQKKNAQYPHNFVDKTQLLAFGAINELVVCQMNPIKELFYLPKPECTKQKSLPYVDWGYGLTPHQREKTMPILAFAWDRLIQLVYITEQKGDKISFELDGFYYTEQEEINSITFIGDSILFALMNGKEAKILYTTKFYPGHYQAFEKMKKDDILNNSLESITSVTQHAEIEKGHELQDLKGTVFQSYSVMNFNQCVKRVKQNIFFMGSKSLVYAHLYSWQEYLNHIKFKENYDWLTVLKVGLEIYNGESKGFAKVPDEKEKREEQLKPYMKEMIKDSVQTVIYKYVHNNQRRDDDEEKKQTTKQPRQKQLESNGSQAIEAQLQADQIAIKASIEFCLNIQAVDFLFNEIFTIFAENKLETKFITNLEPFLTSGQFRKEAIPEKIIKRIINHYEEKKNLKTLEKIIMNLDLKEYSRKDELILTCQAHCMVSAFLYLMTSSTTEDILNQMQKLMRNAKNEYQKEEIYTLNAVDSQKKYEIEKSRSYIGYKLFWIIKMFLEGKMFPYGSLSPERWRMHVYDIANFLTTDEFLKDLINFDSEQFFKITAKLFYGSPYKFIVQQKELQSAQGKKFITHRISPQDIIKEFEKRLNQKEDRIDNFNKFILFIQAQHVTVTQDNPYLDLDYRLVFDALLNVLSKNPVQLEEEIIIDAIKAKQIKDEDLDTIIKQLDSQTQSLTKLRIYIAEQKKDYVQSFKLNLGNTQLRKQIFSWIDDRMEMLQSQPQTQEYFDKLKVSIKNSMQELITINTEDAIKVIEKWMDESYQETLILHELDKYKEIQFEFLKKYLSRNEATISQTIKDAQIKNELRQLEQKYKQYLILHTRLLCQFNKNEVENYVKKDYYPINECLQICKEENAQRGIAVLQKRNGNYIVAIQTYLNIIKQMDVNSMILELNKVIATSKLAGHSVKYDINDSTKYKLLGELEELIIKCGKIATKLQNEVEQEEGWFTVLEFLNQYYLELVEKVEKINQSGQLYTKQQQENKENYERLRDFILKRKNDFLLTVPETISLRTLTERLKLTFNQIKRLYDFKIKAFKNDEKYLKLAKTIQIQELLSLSLKYNSEAANGVKLEEYQKCLNCRTLLSQIQMNTKERVPCRYYKCSHVFHETCINNKKCTFCKKYQIETADKKRARQQKSKVEQQMEESERAAELSMKAREIGYEQQDGMGSSISSSAQR